MSDLTGTKV